MPQSVRVPPALEAIFQQAHEYVARYFQNQYADPSRGIIEIFGERYVLVRAAAVSIDFFDAIRQLYSKNSEAEAEAVTRGLLYDVAHALGAADARNFQRRMQLGTPIERLSAGPIHFAHAGWAFVDIKPESHAVADETYCLIYDHPYSFESDAWLRVGRQSAFPVCVMNAGYSAGWCSESFGLPLTAVEISCKARGDEHCRFVMAMPERIEAQIAAYLQRQPEPRSPAAPYEIPGGFLRKKAAEHDSSEHKRHVEHNHQEDQAHATSAQHLDELALARNVQASLLPERPPWNEQLLVACGRLLPSQGVGGDFYAYAALDEHCVAVALGDIASTGTSAALLMTLAVNAFAHEAQQIDDPAMLLTAINQRLAEPLRTSGTFAAMLVLHINLERGVLRLANAGAVAPLLLRAGEVRMIEAQGVPLGLITDAIYEETLVALQPGDRIVLVSDGIVEVCSPLGERWGFTRLTQALKTAAPGTTPIALRDALLAQVTAFVGDAEQPDDLTVVVLAL